MQLCLSMDEVDGMNPPLTHPAHTTCSSMQPSFPCSMQLCLIMDEVDGMSAGDRGGVGDLIAVRAAEPGNVGRRG